MEIHLLRPDANPSLKRSQRCVLLLLLLLRVALAPARPLARPGAAFPRRAVVGHLRNTWGAAGRRINPNILGLTPIYSRELPLGSQRHSRISSLCVCARAPFVYKPSVRPYSTIYLSIYLSSIYTYVHIHIYTCNSISLLKGMYRLPPRHRRPPPQECDNRFNYSSIYLSIFYLYIYRG